MNGEGLPVSPPLYIVGSSDPSCPQPCSPCLPYLRVPALKLKQVRGPLPTVSVLSSAQCMKPSQFESITVLWDPPAGLNKYYSQHKVWSESGVGKLSVRDQMALQAMQFQLWQLGFATVL